MLLSEAKNGVSWKEKIGQIMQGVWTTEKAGWAIEKAGQLIQRFDFTQLKELVE